MKQTFKWQMRSSQGNCNSSFSMFQSEINRSFLAVEEHIACTTSTPARHQNVQLLSWIFKLEGKTRCLERSVNFVFNGWELRHWEWFVPGFGKRLWPIWDANTNQSWVPAVWGLWASHLVSLQAPSVNVWKCCSGLLGKVCHSPPLLSSHPTTGGGQLTQCEGLRWTPSSAFSQGRIYHLLGPKSRGVHGAVLYTVELQGRRRFAGIHTELALTMPCTALLVWHWEMVGQVILPLWRDVLEQG